MSRHIASTIPRGPRDDAYCFGLFYDVGIPILMQKFPVQFVSLEKKYERRSLGFNQRDMSAGTLAGGSASSTLSSGASARLTVGASCFSNGCGSFRPRGIAF